MGSARRTQIGCLATAVLTGALVASSASGAVLHANLFYDSPGSSDPRLDLFLPFGGAEPEAPTVLFIHGGSWSGGDKAVHILFHNTTADAGFPVVSINYTLSTPTLPSYPQAVHDVKAALRWIRTEGVVSWGLNPTVIVVGSSAGGHLAQLLGTTAGLPAFEPLPPPPAGGYRVDAVVSLWGVGDLVGSTSSAVEQFLGAPYSAATHALYAEASPLTHVSPDDPPMSFLHGTADTVVSPFQSVTMRNACRENQVFSLIELCPGGGHGFSCFGGQAGVSASVQALIPVLLAPPPPGPECDDGLDNDGDGATDAPGDPGCFDAAGAREDPACDDFLDNDGDAGVDWDGAGLAAADPQCVAAPWRDRELPNRCGLGFEVGLLLPLLFWLRRRRTPRRTANVGGA